MFYCIARHWKNVATHKEGERKGLDVSRGLARHGILDPVTQPADMEKKRKEEGRKGKKLISSFMLDKKVLHEVLQEL